VDGGVEPRVFLSARWAGRVVALERRRLAAVAKPPGPWAEGLVECTAESSLRALARLLCRLANNGRVCQYAVMAGQTATLAYRCHTTSG